MEVKDHHYFMREAIKQAKEGMLNGEGGPFGAIVVKDNQIIGRGNNKVLCSNDPTAHAEVVAIRDACARLGSFQLDDCVLYTSCEPCPMCLGAIYWARPKHFFYACTREDAASIDFDDDFIYKEINLNLDERSIPAFPILREEAIEIFELWTIKNDKTLY
jgi:guanine deaminase